MTHTGIQVWWSGKVVILQICLHYYNNADYVDDDYVDGEDGSGCSSSSEW